MFKKRDVPAQGGCAGWVKRAESKPPRIACDKTFRMQQTPAKVLGKQTLMENLLESQHRWHRDKSSCSLIIGGPLGG
jgi:hypothetical protein